MFNTALFDETTFYTQFNKDLLRAEHEVVIESPFISTARMDKLASVFERLVGKGVKVFVITRDPNMHSGEMATQAEEAIRYFETIGVQVLVTINKHHRKLAILDRNILWEGSLNILSQNDSREIMRRTESCTHALEMFNFLKLGRFI